MLASSSVSLCGGRSTMCFQVFSCYTKEERRNSIQTHASLAVWIYVPKVNVIAEQYVFQQRKQALNESTAKYMAVLRGIAANCQFVPLTDEVICDQVAECTLYPRLWERFLSADLGRSLVTEAYETSQRRSLIMTGLCSSQQPRDVAKVSFINFKKPFTCHNTQQNSVVTVGSNTKHHE